MTDIVATVIEEDTVNFEAILMVFGAYIAVVWLMFCFWVFIDAKKRYDHLLTAVIFALFIIPFNIPGLILYLVVRPEDEWPDLDDDVTAFANVPVVRLVDDQEEILLKLQIELKRPVGSKDIIATVTGAEPVEERNISTEEKGNDLSSDQEVLPIPEKVLLKKKFRNSFSNIGSNLKNLASRAKIKAKYMGTVDRPTELEAPTTIEVGQSSKKNKKKHKKHHQR